MHSLCPNLRLILQTVLQVVRYTALASGILYGIVHRRTLTAREHEKHAQHEQHRKEHLLEQARAAWKEKNSPAAKSRTRSLLLLFNPLRHFRLLSLVALVLHPEHL